MLISTISNTAPSVLSWTFLAQGIVVIVVGEVFAIAIWELWHAVKRRLGWPTL